MTDTIRICRVCSIEHKVERNKNRYVMGICPICEEYHALFEVVNGQPNQGDRRANDYAAIRTYDRVLSDPPEFPVAEEEDEDE
jgi:hypothetical protein